MPTTDSTEDLHVLGDVDTGLSCALSLSPPLPLATASLPPASVPAAPSCDTDLENRAASMSNTDCNKALSSPAEASPAKLTPTSPARSDVSGDNSPSMSHIASAADSLPCQGSNIINMEQEASSTATPPPSTPFGGDTGETDYPAKLTFKGVTVTLESSKVWNDFHKVGTEMILTRPGRHMFPYCRYRVTGLDPERKYSMVLSIPPSDAYKYRWCGQKWEVYGLADHSSQGLIRAFAHHYSPSTGAEWMNVLISFKKLKLTNNDSDQEGNIILHSLHRYIPRLHIIPVPDSVAPTADQPVVMGPESMTFTFPQTEFMGVTTYNNFRITQMKIRYNPFAKGFREDGHNPRLKRIMKRDVEFVNVETAGESATAEKEPEPSSTEHSEHERPFILKPIMNPFSPEKSAYVQCRGKHALGNLILAQTPTDEPKKEPARPINLTPPMKLCITVNSKAKFRSSSTARLLPKYKKKKKFRGWGFTHRKGWGHVALPQTPAPPPVSIQPELDDVEGLLFVSFTSKAALDSHIGDQPVIQISSQSTSSEPPVQQQQQIETGSLESEADKLLLFEAQLLQDLQVLKHRQTIHPVLQEVGLKLSSLEPSQSLDLQYLGVELPLSPDSSSDGAEGSSFISRTGKTSDITKIKGWRNKFISSESWPHSDATPTESSGSKNSSAFCSDMLDEYLETEEQQISERAEAFSSLPQGSVSYELPAKSSSYVKTLDSALRHRTTPPASASNKPCPVSYKLSHSEPSSPASSSPSVSPAPSEESDVVLPSPAPGPALNISVLQRLSKYLRDQNPKPAVISRGNQQINHLNSGLSRPQQKLYNMEVGAWNSGLERTQVTPNRVMVALSALMTKWTQLNDVFKVPEYRVQLSECREEFCRLGCVCDSLHGSLYKDRGPYHCRRPECMFQCSCFKQEIGKYFRVSVPGTASSYVIKNPEKLWVKNIIDSDREVLQVPDTNTVDVMVLPKPPKPVPNIREEDKDPVYKYLESRLTCARVREFTNKAHHIETFEDLTANTNASTATADAAAATTTTPAAPAAPAAPAPKSTTFTATTTTPAGLPSVLRIKAPTTSTLPTSSTKPAETTQEKLTQNMFVLKKKSELGTEQVSKRPRTLIELQSSCKWAKEDRKMVLQALCLNMNKNKLCRPFCVGPYHIKPIAKVIMQKPNESVITYKVRISLKSNSGSGADSDGSDGENKPREEKGTEEKRGERETRLAEGVTPFLSGIQPAGVLKGHTKQSGKNLPIEVNGKSYSHARLMLGRMGSLHPANRVAAFVTGRLNATSNLYKKPSELAPKVTAAPSVPSCPPSAPSCPPSPSSPPSTVRPAAAPAQADPDRPALPPLVLPPALKAWTLQKEKPSPTQTMPPPPPPPKPLRDSPFQSSTPVALTVSPSLKAPSFLGQKGTYSFRLCPPDNDKCKKLPGVSLPGGFTLIQLSKPEDPPPKQTHFSQIQNKASNAARLAQIFGYALKSKPMVVNSTPIEISDDSGSESESESESGDSDFSDDDEEIDVDDELSVDVESVFSTEQKQMMNRLRIAAGLGPQRKFMPPQNSGTEGYNISERNYVRMCSERQRRIEHKELFDHLQTVLEPGSGLQTPKIHLLTMATKEIKMLKERSKYLEEKKKLLTQIQDGYVKEIALMSGNSEETILERLRDVCEKQKRKEQMASNSSYSDLLQSNAAMVQAISNSSKPETTPLLPPVVKVEPSSPVKDLTIDESPSTTEPQEPPETKPNAAEQIQATAKNFVQQLLSKLKPIIHNAKSCHQIAKVRRAMAAREKSGGMSASSESSVSSTPSASSAPTTAPTTAATTAATTNKPQTLALPLVRTKDGRIILPSSVKPAAQTYYTLKLLNSAQGQQGTQRPTVLLQPLDAAAVTQQNLNRPGSDTSSSKSQPLPAPPPANPPQPMIFKSPLASIGYLNKSISSHSVPATSTTSPAFVSLPNSTQLQPNAPKTHHNPTFYPPTLQTPPAKRGRGRPRKHPLPDGSVHVSASKVVIKEDPDFSPSYYVSHKRPAALFSPPFPPVKRGRGRPPKNLQSRNLDPYSCRIKEEDEEWDIATHTSNKTNRARHLTRASLGKDFPSAKRRSWVDTDNDFDVDID